MPRLALLSTSDTDLLSARASGADWALANPARLDVAADLPALLADVDLVIVRILGTARSWQDGLDALTARGLPTVVLGGEQVPDAELMRLSTVPIGIAAQAHQYLTEGGAANLRQQRRVHSHTPLPGSGPCVGAGVSTSSTTEEQARPPIGTAQPPPAWRRGQPTPAATRSLFLIPKRV